ncbi:CPBP family intramembrane glutamic endopeptidase [Microbacterium sp. SA39]|uniref:CPBP family intramembrane glutamic endopeptidase n=1 Tax=Microbacterium sp. SA39 TaxID=1263625 RepID=UPI00061F5AC8|nr:type II CAAX endopeptidase family protein [Microbacterium sp. SA39]KJQ52735.1 CAAX amino terminal protease self- immunity [Microbacterium sp. SA39]
MHLNNPHLVVNESTPRPDKSPEGMKIVPPGVEYHRVLADDKRRIGRGILAIVLVVGGMWAAILGFAVLARMVDGMLGVPQSGEGRGLLTPTMHAFGCFATALLIPWSMLVQHGLYRVPGASLHSVFSRFRFRLFTRTLFIIAPLFVVLNVVSNVILPTESVVWLQSDLLWLLAATLLLSPLQAAGEEYGVRGLIFRVAGSWGRGPRTSLILGVVVSALVFAAFHLSFDPYLYIWYSVLAVSSALITWRSGGIEIAVVLHAAFNTLSFVFAVGMSGDLTAGLDRSVADPSSGIALIGPCLVVIATLVVVWFRTRHTGPMTTPAVESQRPAAFTS